MGVRSVVMTATKTGFPLDASGVSGNGPEVSGFLTIQSLTNFAAMTGAISAAWHSLQTLSPGFAALWVPYGLAAAFAIISVGMSAQAMKNAQGAYQLSAISAALFVGFLNALVLAGAVVGTATVANRPI